ncbi:MAG: hypothetical protein CMF50_09120 [Legionellales bacterium]|nr:hypothetical protein [Legionellales bacterium]
MTVKIRFYPTSTEDGIYTRLEAALAGCFQQTKYEGKASYHSSIDDEQNYFVEAKVETDDDALVILQALISSTSHLTPSTISVKKIFVQNKDGKIYSLFEPSLIGQTLINAIAHAAAASPKLLSAPSAPSLLGVPRQSQSSIFTKHPAISATVAGGLMGGGWMLAFKGVMAIIAFAGVFSGFGLAPGIIGLAILVAGIGSGIATPLAGSAAHRLVYGPGR